MELLCEWKVTRAVSSQLNAISQGFSEYIPPVLVQLFSEPELALLINGDANIDVEDWRKHTEYTYVFTQMAISISAILINCQLIPELLVILPH